MWRAWITQPFNSTVTYGQLNMLHLKSVGESLVVPYGGSNIFLMIFKKSCVLHLFLKKYDYNISELLNFLLKSIMDGFFFIFVEVSNMDSKEYIKKWKYW